VSAARNPAIEWARSILPLATGILLALAMWRVVSPAVGAFHSRVLLDIGIAVIMAVSLNIVNGYTGQFSIGHAGFMTLGAYVSAGITYYASCRLWGSPVRHGGPFGTGEWLYVGAILAGGVVAAVAGWAVGLPSLRLRGDYLAIVTLGFGEIVRVLLTQSKDQLSGKAQIAEAGPIEMAAALGGALGFSRVPTYTNTFWVYLFVALTLIVAYRLKESTIGRSYLAIRENEIAAEAMGVPVAKFKVRAFVMAAFFAGIAGGLYAHTLGVSITPKDAGFMKSFDVLIMVVLGGMGSISGVVLAAIGLTILPELLRDLNQYRMVLYALLLIIVMIVRPKGLFGIHEIWELKVVRRIFRRRAPA